MIVIKHYEESDQTPKNTSAQYMNEQKLAIAHEKVTNQRLYYLHKVSSRLIDEHHVIIIETLRIETMLKNHP